MKAERQYVLEQGGQEQTSSSTIAIEKGVN
jgi:hypothetical protein